MPVQVLAAIISAVVSFVIALISVFFSWKQLQGEKAKIRQERVKIQQERTQWLVDIKSSYALEIYKARLVEYPKMGEILGRLSKHAPTQLTPEKAKQIASEIHTWLYSHSPGGLYAESSTRGALKELRAACSTWERGEKPVTIGDWRHIALFLLRRDLDIEGIESFDPLDRGPLLTKMEELDKTLRKELYDTKWEPH
jgi:hypothetical protein